MRVAFDIDDTLWKIRRRAPLCDETCPKPYCTVHNPKFDQVPDYDLIQVLRWFATNGDEVFVWSAGGVDYAQQIVTKLGLDELVTVIPKSEPQEGNTFIDIAFDDCETRLAKVDVQVRREANGTTE